METALAVVQDAVLDTLYLVPFLLATYLLMEWIEHRTGERAQAAIRRAGWAGPAIGALLGAVPQCGFSAAASTLYAGRVVTLGTLYAVFLSTSDEMLPIFIAEQVSVSTLLMVMGSKVAIGMVFGFATDAVLRASHRQHEERSIHEICERDHCHCNGEHEGASGIVRSAVRHTVQVTVFILLISLVLNALLAAVGEAALGDILSAHDGLSVLGAGIVGLIPNCAASVAIAQLYVDGILGPGALMSGLLSAAGIGLLVLLRTNRHAKENVLIVVILLAISVACGLTVDALGFTF